MQQISPPLRIALAAVLLVAVVWFVALRPKGGEEAAAPLPAPAPGVQGLTSGIEKARNAKEAADAAAARSQATGEDAAADAAAPASASAAKASGASGTATTRAARTRARSGDPAAPLVRALDDDKAVVLLFRNGSSDSAAVADVVRSVPRRGGRVVVRVVSIADVGRYDAFTRNTPVSQAPTVLVMGPTRKGKVIVGFTSSGEVDQAVGQVLVAKR